MLRIEKRSTPHSITMGSPTSKIPDMDNRGAFSDPPVNLLKPYRILHTEKTYSFENTFLNSNECAFIFDLSQNRVLYKKGFYELLGYKEEDINALVIEDLYHPDDYELTMKIFRAAILHCLYYPEHSSDNTLFVSFRIKRKNGSYIKVLSKSTVLNMDIEGRILRSLVKFTDISFIDKTDFINWDFKAGKLDREEFKSQIYGSVHDNLFTKRETEVISLIEKKLSSEEIACNLSISKHTVATHRKNIFKKSECHHPAELINFCRMRGVL